MEQQVIQTHRRACHLCEAICGLEIKVADGKIVSIKGDKNDPLSRGHICPKAVALQDLHEDPNRLRQPVKRIGDPNGNPQWQTISWDEALDTAAQRLVAIAARHGNDALGIYLGNPSVHNYGMLTHQKQFLGLLRTRNRYSATSVDQLPHHLTALWLYGHKNLLPVPDIDRSSYLLVLGGNPLASNGSIWTVPDVKKRITDLKKRGGKLVVVDPRFTETAAIADQHHYIRPGSDAALLLAMLNTIFQEGLAKPGRLAGFVTGLEQVAAAITEFTPDAAAAATGVAASDIRQLARDFASADKAVCYGRMGVSVQQFGALNHWLINLLNIVTGNLDAQGGAMFPSPAFDNVALAGPGGFDRYRSRVSGLPEFDREFPVAVLAEEMLTPGDGQIRALFTGAGNPVLSTPDGSRLEQALAGLEFMVALDPYINETTRFADIILPPTSPLEHDHYDMAFHSLAVHNTARMNEPVFAQPEGSLHDWEIFNQLGVRTAALMGVAAPGPESPAQFVDIGIQMGPYGANAGHPLALDMDKIRQHPSGLDLGALQAQLPARLCTADKTIRCDIPAALADLQRVREQLFNGVANASQQLSLIGRRHVRSNNSWMHNFHRLVKGKPRCTLLMHPVDAAQRQLSDGDAVQLQSAVASLTVALEVSEHIMPGVVSMPHGWGHGRNGVKMDIAVLHAGASCNDLTDSKQVDRLSGNAVLNGVPVTVCASA